MQWLKASTLRPVGVREMAHKETSEADQTKCRTSVHRVGLTPHQLLTVYRQSADIARSRRLVRFVPKKRKQPFIQFPP